MAAKRKKATKKPSKPLIDELYPGFTSRSEQGRKSNARGKEYERDVANALKPLFPKAARLFGQAREGYEVPDVGGTPYWIECAKGSTNAIHDKLKQGLIATDKSDSIYSGAPVIVFSKHDRSGEHMSTMRREDFLHLLALIGVVRDRSSVERRFWSKIDKNGPMHAGLGSRCWDWTAAKTDGYGQIYIEQSMVYAHRVSYELAHGPIIDSRFVLHRCDRRSCCNPEHLYLGDAKQNMRDRKDRGGYATGEKHARSKLTDEQVREIRELQQDGFTSREVAKRYSVSASQISRIWSNKSR